jgi:hypothetical protein
MLSFHDFLNLCDLQTKIREMHTVFRNLTNGLKPFNENLYRQSKSSKPCRIHATSVVPKAFISPKEEE